MMSRKIFNHSMTSVILIWMLVLTFQGVYARETCKQYIRSPSFGSYYRTYYCSNYCCGTTYTAKCCDRQTSVSTVYVTAGSVGGVVGFCIFVGIIVVVIKACNRPNNQVHFLQTSRQGAIVHM
ncbi:uncharacterized protein LOC124262914 isoform X1 [Haliotis rubra]|uniref:uncharacterized protein LOC124262914 isoform X1 n=1 Tax=Haliotis rubra TaxID=36100 RepID=UPI001EE56967|nr:uncharacterized protein LOC124262914 isoform X1 [Haliotis rubra]